MGAKKIKANNEEIKVGDILIYPLVSTACFIEVTKMTDKSLTFRCLKSTRSYSSPCDYTSTPILENPSDREVRRLIKTDSDGKQYVQIDRSSGYGFRAYKWNGRPVVCSQD